MSSLEERVQNIEEKLDLLIDLVKRMDQNTTKPIINLFGDTQMYDYGGHY
jgi:hypothetical protein